MNTFLNTLASPEWTQLVKTLLHTLWQGAVAAALLAAALRFCRSPAVRYRCSLLALFLTIAAGIATWAGLHQPKNHPGTVSTRPAFNQPRFEFESEPEVVAFADAPSSKASRKLPWTAWCAVIWIAGAGLMLLRAGTQLAGAERLRRASRPLENEAISQLLLDAQRALQITRRVRIAVTEHLTTPAVVGVLIPTLVLPLSLVTSLSHEQIRFILLHELAHIRRHDYLLNLIQLFAEALLFFNPAVWWISHQIRREREACCDALAIESSGASAEYARTLLHVAEQALTPVAAATAFAGRENSSLADRVQRLLVPGYRPALRLTWRAMAATLLAGSALLLLANGGTRIAVAAFRPGATSLETPSNVRVQTSNSETNLLNSSIDSVESNPTNGIQPQTEQRLELTAEKSETRIFTFEPQVFYPNLRNRFSIPPSVTEDALALAQFPNLLGQLGIHVGNAVLKDYGLMMLHGSRADLDKVQELMVELNGGRTNIPFPNPPARTTTSPPAVPRVSVLSPMQEFELQFIGLDDVGPFSFGTDTGTLWPLPTPRFRIIPHYSTPPLEFGFAVPSAATKAQLEELRSSSVIQSFRTDLSTLRIVGNFAFNLDQLRLAMTKWFSDGGVELAPPKGVFVSSNELVILATYPDLLRAAGGTAKRAAAAPTNNLPSRQIIRTSDARRVIMTKLQELRFDQLSYEAKPLGEIIWDLQRRTREADPEGAGIRFTVSLSEAPKVPAIDSTTGLPQAVAPGAGPDLNSVPVTIRPPLSNVPVKDVLDALVEATGRRIRWSITENGVMFSPKSEELYPVRTFKLNWRAFTTGLHRETGTKMPELESAAQIITAFTKVLAKRDIRLQNVFCNPRTETVMMRGSASDLELAEELLNELTYTPPQVNIRSRFFSVPENRMGEVLRILGETNANPVQSISVVLQETNFIVAMRAVEALSGVTVLSQGDVTTLSGRQAQVQTIDLKIILTDINPKALTPPGIISSNGTNDLFQLRKFPAGPTLDVIASVSEDGQSVSLRAIATLTEFLGYEKGSNVIAYVDGRGADVMMPVPKFRVAQATSESVIADGQTVVLVSGPKRSFTGIEGTTEPQQETASADEQNHQVITFVTPTVIDAAGNRVNQPAQSKRQ